MPDSIDYRVRVVSNHLPSIAAGIPAKAAAIVAKAALDIEAHAKSRAPVDTGFLKGSIQATQISPTHWRVIVGAEYGIYQEYGTVHMAARPYFNPAIQVVRPVFIAAMRKVAT